MELWLVGRVRDPRNWREWEFMGVFDTQAAAVAACTRPGDFVQPITLNDRAPDAITEATGATYPLLDEAHVLPTDRPVWDAAYTEMIAWYATHAGTDPH